MTQRNPRLQKPPVLVWVGLGTLLLGALSGQPGAFRERALQTVCMVAGQVLLLGSMLHVAWRAGWGKPLVLLALVALLIVGAGFQLWALWDVWQAEQLMRRRGL